MLNILQQGYVNPLTKIALGKEERLAGPLEVYRYRIIWKIDRFSIRLIILRLVSLELFW